MIIRYCTEWIVWVFTLEDLQHENNECGHRRIESIKVFDQDTFDFLDSSIDWFEKGNEDRLIQMEDIGLYCIDEKDKPPDSYIHSSGLCPVLGIDERYGQFQGTRSWPSSFMMLVDQNNRTAKVYNRPVFVSTVSSRQGFPSLIMFLGKQGQSLILH